MSGLLIESEPLDGLSVYGISPSQYTVDGVAGLDYTSAVLAGTLQTTLSFEGTLRAMSKVFEVRQKKLEELGEALAVLNRAIESVQREDRTSSSPTGIIPELAEAGRILSRYGISHMILAGVSKYGEVTKAQNSVERELDRENMTLQQDISTMQSLFSKRDSQYSTAAELVKTANDTLSQTIRRIGR